VDQAELALSVSLMALVNAHAQRPTHNMNTVKIIKASMKRKPSSGGPMLQHRAAVEPATGVALRGVTGNSWPSLISWRAP
jgi:hypothetical protein